MGMIQNIDLKGTQTERDNMPPERLSAWLGIKKDTLYKAYKIVGKGKWATGVPLLAADVDALVLYYADRNERAKSLAETLRTAKETEKKAEEKEVVNTAPTTETEKESTESKKKASRWYYLADLVFFGVSGIVAYELWFFLKVWGLLFWGVYAGALFFCLAMAKDKRVPETAQYGYTAVVILECVAFFSHLSMANNLAIKAAKAGELPFLYNQWSGSMTAPFYIACALAAVLSGVPVFLLWARMSITKELAK